MRTTALVTLNMRELDRLKVVQAVVEMGLKPGRAAERLGLTVRQVERLVTRYRELGAPGLASRKRGRRGNRRLSEELACRALAIIRERYADFGPTLACEKLRLMMLHFTASESTFSYFEATRAYIERYGKPQAFYSDKASVFRPTTKGADGVTHFGRAMYELNIDTFCANSSPAKRRVERAHHTLQDRLVKELRLREISTIAEANTYTPSFMAAYNARFAKPPKSEFDAHRPLRADEDLERLFTWRELRKVTKSLTVQYDRVLYLLEDTIANRKLIGRYLEVWEYPDGRIEIRSDGVSLPCVPYDRLSHIDQGAVVEHKRLSHVLQLAQVLQAQRDDRRVGSPSRTNRGLPARNTARLPGTKKQREFTQADVNLAIEQLAQQNMPAQKPPRKPGRRSARVIA